MGRKKQKVRWTIVEETAFFAGNEDSSSGSENFRTSNHVNGNTNKQNSEGPPHICPAKPYPARRYGPHWSLAPLAPRFERKAAAEAAKAAAAAQNGQNMTVFYDGECCETEQLPDGFTKIRSKNLDVLFKRDYYSHKIDFNRSSCSSEPGDDPGSEFDEESENCNTNENTDEKAENSEITDDCNKNQSENIQDIPEETSPENGCEKSEKSAKVEDGDERSFPDTDNGPYPYSPDAPPFVPSSQSRPNLFLYSPSSNTMIPCEEIIIPNPVMGPEGPMYQGPSNIYLAFPMDGNPNGSHNIPPVNGNGYLSQQFIPPQIPAMQYDQYGMPYQPYQPPQTITVEHTGSCETTTTIYQSTSSDGSTEPSSADSTTPHSPPDLSVYSPSNWAASAHFDQGIASPPNGTYAPVNNVPSWYNSAVPSTNNTVSEPSEINEKVVMESATVKHDVSQSSDQTSSNKSHIPGLNPDLLNNANSSKKRVQKKKRRKKQNGSSGSNNSSPVKAPFKLRQDICFPPEEKSQEEVEGKEIWVSKILEPANEILSDQPSSDQPSSDQPSSDQPSSDQPSSDQSSSDQNPSDQPSSDQSSSDQTPSDQPTSDKPTSDQPTSDQPTSNQPTSDQPTSDQLSSDQPCLDQPSSEQPSSEQLSLDQPSSDQSPSDEPPSDQSPSDQSSLNQISSDQLFSNKTTPDRSSPEMKATCVETSNSVKELLKDVNTEHTLCDGGWETKKRKSRKGHKKYGKKESAQTYVPEPSHESLVQDEVVKEEKVTKNDLEVVKEASVEPQVKEMKETHVEDVIIKEEELDQTSSKRPSNRRSKKKRYASYELSETRPSTHQVLIQDGFIEFASPQPRCSNSPNPTDVLKNAQIDTVFISSIGHGIQQGPLFLGRLRQGKYNPPDRSNEIPLKYRQSNEEHIEQQIEEEITQEIELE